MTSLRTHEEVEYEHPAQGKDHCWECRFWEGPTSGMLFGCQKVEPPVRPKDWCELFRRAKS